MRCRNDEVVLTACMGRVECFDAAVGYARPYVERGYGALPFEDDGAWKVQIFLRRAIDRIEHLKFLDKEFRFKPAGQVPKPKGEPGRPRKIIKEER